MNYNGVDFLSAYLPPPAVSPKDTNYTYDNDRLLTQLLAPGTNTPTITYGYDPFGRLGTLNESTGDLVTYDYDGSGRVAGIYTAAGVGRSFTYAGPFITQVKSTLPSWGNSAPPSLSRTVDYTYDPLGRVASISVDGAPATAYSYAEPKPGTCHGTCTSNANCASTELCSNLTCCTAADDGLFSGMTSPNLVYLVTRDPGTGLVSATSFTVTTPPNTHSVTEAYSYNTAGELTHLTDKKDGTTIFEEDLQRDGGGRVAQKTDCVGDALPNCAAGVNTRSVYSYIDLSGAPDGGSIDTGRLQQVDVYVTVNGTTNHTTTTYGYDANGNRTKVNGALIGTYDSQDRMTVYNGVNYGYTNNGELSSRNSTPNTSYSYDLRGNLRSVTPPGVTFIIDGEGRRVGKKLQSTGALTQGFVYGTGPRPVADLNGDGTIKSTYFYGQRQYTPDYMTQGTSTYRILSDYLGSPRLLVNLATGASPPVIAEELDYDEWGNLTHDSLPGAPLQPFGFTGGIYDRDAGFVRLGARDYDPSTGRWASKDPVRFIGGFNLYAYSDDDPVNRTDGSGQLSRSMVCLIVAEQAYNLCKANMPPTEASENFCQSVLRVVEDLCNRLPPQVPPNTLPCGPPPPPPDPGAGAGGESGGGGSSDSY